MTCREILTLQFGHYANYVGTHWWNAQELSFEYNANKPSEINHDVLFREGVTPKGEVTFTPRLLLVDLKGSLKSLPKGGTLYEAAQSIDEVDSLWFQPAVVEQEPLINKNTFQKALEKPSISQQDTEHFTTLAIEEEFEVWSDFSYTRYHPRTMNLIKEYEHNNFENEFSSFPLGCTIWKTNDYEEEFTDKIRMYIEECDNFQGFQILLDSTNGFSGLSSSCIEHLHDEYDSKNVFAMPLIPGYYHDYKWDTEEDENSSKIKDCIRVLNLAFCFKSLAEEASLFTPLCVAQDGFRQPGSGIHFNHVDYKIDSSYHTSAILASALDTFTLNYRLKSTHYSLTDLTVDLTSYGRKAVAGSLCLPFSFNQGADLIECLDNWDGLLSQSLTPKCKLGDRNMMQLVTLRGIPEDRLKRPIAQAGKQKDMPAYKCNNVSEMLNMYYSYTCDSTVTNVTSIEKGFCAKTPFPQIFKPEVSIQGNIMVDKRLENVGVESVPVLAGLHTGAEIGLLLEKLRTETRKIRLTRFHQFIENGYGKDEFEECLDKLFTLRECYEDSYVI